MMIMGIYSVQGLMVRLVFQIQHRSSLNPFDHHRSSLNPFDNYRYADIANI